MAKVDTIALANEKVHIEHVLEYLFDIVAPEGSVGWKTNCPLDFEHSDGGRTQAMRIYPDSNTAWCFSHTQRFTPVKLWQLKYDLSARKASIELLKHFKIRYGPMPPAEKWAHLNTLNKSVPVDKESLKGLVVVYAEMLPNYTLHQYDIGTLDFVNKVLCSVEELEDGASYAKIEGWLTLAKYALEEYWRSRGWD